MNKGILKHKPEKMAADSTKCIILLRKKEFLTKNEQFQELVLCFLGCAFKEKVFFLKWTNKTLFSQFYVRFNKK